MKKVHLSDRTFRLVFTLGLLIVIGLFLAIESVPYSTDAAALRVGGNVERRVRLMDRLVREASMSRTTSSCTLKGFLRT